MSDLGYFFPVIKPNDMLANPFLWCEDDKFFLISSKIDTLFSLFLSGKYKKKNPIAASG
jgi:hypothetical protein